VSDRSPDWAGAERPERAAALLVAERTPDWVEQFIGALDRRMSGESLSRILATWGLSQAEAARLFGVSRQAVSKWMTGGLPPERAVAAADLAAATDLLVRYLRRERIPAVVRRPAGVLDGRTLLEVAADDPRAAREAVRAMFDFARIPG
jgi:predicted transcriptional regulator